MEGAESADRRAEETCEDESDAQELERLDFHEGIHLPASSANCEMKISAPPLDRLADKLRGSSRLRLYCAVIAARSLPSAPVFSRK